MEHKTFIHMPANDLSSTRYFKKNSLPVVMSCDRTLSSNLCLYACVSLINYRWSEREFQSHDNLSSRPDPFWDLEPRPAALVWFAGNPEKKARQITQAAVVWIINSLALRSKHLINPDGLGPFVSVIQHGSRKLLVLISRKPTSRRKKKKTRRPL